MELRQAKNQGFATGYAAGTGILGHAVARSNGELRTLIANASAILEPGFFAPARNHELIEWLLELYSSIFRLSKHQ